MSAPYRIIRQSPTGGGIDGSLRAPLSAEQQPANEDLYKDRLIKLIPGEVVALYLVGQGIIPQEGTWVQFVWIVICLVGLIMFRIQGTRDPVQNQSPQIPSVIIASLAFLIWVYTLGGPFASIGIHIPYVGSLLVLIWTFFIPLVYKGDLEED